MNNLKSVPSLDPTENQGQKANLYPDICGGEKYKESQYYHTRSRNHQGDKLVEQLNGDFGELLGDKWALA